MKEFIYREMRHCVRDGFSILLPAADTVRVFGDKLKISCIAAVPQEHQRLRLIINLSAQPCEGMPISKISMDRVGHRY